MPRPLSDYLNGTYEIVIDREDLPDGREVFVARLECLPRCLAQGDTEIEALLMLEGNRRRMFQERWDRGVELPEPSAVVGPIVTTTSLAAVAPVMTFGDALTETNAAPNSDLAEVA